MIIFHVIIGRSSHVGKFYSVTTAKRQNTLIGVFKLKSTFFDFTDLKEYLKKYNNKSFH